MEHSFSQAFVTSVRHQQHQPLKNGQNKKKQQQDQLHDKIKSEEIVQLQNKIKDYLKQIPNNSNAIKAIQNLGLSPKILQIDLKQLYRVICANPFGKFQYAKLLVQKVSKLNSIVKELDKITRMSHEIYRKNSSMDLKDSMKTKVVDFQRQKQSKLSKTMKWLKSYYKKQLVDEVNYRRKNQKILKQNSFKQNISIIKQERNKPKTSNIERRSMMIQSQTKPIKQKKRLESVPDISNIKQQSRKNSKRSYFKERVKKNRQYMQQDYLKYIQCLKQHQNNDIIPQKTLSCISHQKTNSRIDQHLLAAHRKKQTMLEKVFLTNLNSIVQKQMGIVNARNSAFQMIREKTLNSRNKRKALKSVRAQESIQIKQNTNRSFRKQYENNGALQKKNIHLKTVSEGIRFRNQVRFSRANTNLQKCRGILENKISQINSKQFFKKKDEHEKDNIIHQNFKLREKKRYLDSEIARLKNLTNEDLEAQLSNFDGTFLNAIR